MLKQLEDQKRLIKEGKPGSGTLVSNMVQASTDIEGGGGNKRDTKPLTEFGILGNIITYKFAGHDTTAIVSG